jgi:predicted glycoside hydrolase/deacetylase ChbG (UPF0249 family)
VAPDFIDGHQHVHAPGRTRRRARRPEAALCRLPAAGARSCRQRHGYFRSRQRKKSLLLATLARGFGDAVRAAGFIANTSFAGVSAFDEAKSYRAELERFFAAASSRHLVMCHPGHVDEELPGVDPVVGRRAQELAV